MVAFFHISFITLMLIADVAIPTFTSCPVVPVVVNRYTLLRPNLPNLLVADNTGVNTNIISPVNANSSLYVGSPLTVQYVATDFAGNSADCSVNVFLIGKF